MYFLRNLNTVDPINLHANVFILGINKNTTKYAVYGCLQTVIMRTVQPVESTNRPILNLTAFPAVPN